MVKAEEGELRGVAFSGGLGVRVVLRSSGKRGRRFAWGTI